MWLNFFVLLGELGLADLPNRKRPRPALQDGGALGVGSAHPGEIVVVVVRPVPEEAWVNILTI